MRKYFPNTPAAVVVYGEIVAITLVAVAFAVLIALWSIGQWRSPEGLTSAELVGLANAILNMLVLAAASRLGKQNKEISHEVNGNLDKRLYQQRQNIDQDARDLHQEHKDNREDI